MNINAENKTILIVDDSKTARLIIKKCMIMAGFHDYRYLEAANGREALLELKNTRVCLLLTDFNMPIMDGGVLLKWMKSNPQFKEIPVVIITSAGNPARDKQLLEDGAYTVLPKPISPAAITQNLNSFLEK